MPTKKKIIDSIRIKILSAMREDKAISPNIKQIQKITGFHRATIKSSINFLEQNKFIEGYRPLLNPKIAGYNLNSKVLLQVDMSDKKKFNDFLKMVDNDSSVVACSQVIADNQSNIFLEMLSKNIEQYYKDFQEKYYLKTTNVYDFIRNREMFYLSEPTYKKKNEIDTLIDLLEKDVGK
jgi:DNA-binding Lrp family transcriptional regulator